jgi:hypothetical protein
VSRATPVAYDAEELGRAAKLASGLDGELRKAHRHGLTAAALRHLQSLIDERTRNAWLIGDMLVTLYGPPPAPGVMDGSRARLDALADELGVSTSWLVACRITASAWSRRERRSVAWPVHRALSARPDRIELLGEFRKACAEAKVTPSAHRLADWLDESTAEPVDIVDPDGLSAETAVTAESAEVETTPTPEVVDAPLRVVTRSPGRPRLAPELRVERAAMKLDAEALVRLIDKLMARLEALTAPVAATA